RTAPCVAGPAAEHRRITGVVGGGRLQRCAGRPRTGPTGARGHGRAPAGAGGTAGTGANTPRLPAPLLAADSQLPNPARLRALLLDARLSYAADDAAPGRRSVDAALRIADREQRGLPLAMERGWLGPVLRRDPELADAHRSLLTAA